MNYKITYEYFNGHENIVKIDYMLSQSDNNTYTMQTALRDFKISMSDFPTPYKIITVEEV